MSNFRLFWQGFWETLKPILYVLFVIGVIVLMTWGIIEFTWWLESIIGTFFAAATSIIGLILITCIISGIAKVWRNK